MAKTYITRTGKRHTAAPGDFLRMNDLPYGIWTCADGREVLFNRFYEPIFQRLTGERPTGANPTERVPFVKQDHFYSDGTSNKEAAARAALAAWGLLP